jgi:hypothetical protein
MRALLAGESVQVNIPDVKSRRFCLNRTGGVGAASMQALPFGARAIASSRPFCCVGFKHVHAIVPQLRCLVRFSQEWPAKPAASKRW